jgi:N-hydroxyarylamine O-acetyltransferase
MSAENATPTDLDIDAYFARIGYDGPRDVSLSTLNAIVFAHVTAIPFENIDVLLGRGIDLELSAIAQKLVHARRGGYCFEHNTWLLHVLTTLGFEAQAVSARVRIGRARDFTPPRTHVFVLVTLDGERWLADVGVGGLSPTAALRLSTDTLGQPQATPHEPRRIIAEGAWSGLSQRSPDARLFHQAQLADGQWHDVCEFTLEVMHPIDRELGNWFTSAHPRSHFRDRLIVARATPTGRVTLLNRELTERGPDGVGHTRLLESPEALVSALAQHFDLDLPAETRFPGLD